MLSGEKIKMQLFVFFVGAEAEVDLLMSDESLNL